MAYQIAQGLISDRRLGQVERQVAAEDAKLAGLQRAIGDAEHHLEETKAQADFQSCRAEVKEIRAEVGRRNAACAKEVADQNLCIVRNEKRTAEAGLKGCTLGIVFTVLFGGTGAWSLAGCQLGVAAGERNASVCPVPVCTNTMAQTQRDVLTERGLSAMPRCGGYAGLELSEMTLFQDGVMLDRIGEGTYAVAAGLQPGDIIVALNRLSTTTFEGLRQALDSSGEGQSLPVRFVRDGRLFESQATATHVGLNGLEPNLQVGAEISFATASYRAGARVRALSPEGPARSAGLAPGDQLLSLSVKGVPQPITIATVDAAERALEDCGPLETVTFKVARGGKQLSLSVPLRRRGAETSL